MDSAETKPTDSSPEPEMTETQEDETPEGEVTADITEDSTEDNEPGVSDHAAENVKPSIKVTLETLTPPGDWIDTPRPRMDPPSFDTELRRRKREEENSEPRLSSISCELEEAAREPQDEDTGSELPEEPHQLPSTPCGQTTSTEARLPSTPCGQETSTEARLPSTPCGQETSTEARLPSTPCGQTTSTMEMEAQLPSTPCGAVTQVRAMEDDAQLPSTPGGAVTTEKPVEELHKLPSTPCWAETRTAPRQPLTPGVQEIRYAEGAEKKKEQELLGKPESALFFALFMAASVYLGLFCLVRWLFWSDNGFVVVPIFLMTFGVTMDNYRLYRGVLMGESGLDKTLTTVSYLLQFSAIPLVAIALAEIFSYQTGWWLIPLPVRVLSVAFCVSNFNGFMSGVQGHYDVSSDGGVWRHTLDPFKVPFQLMITPVLIAVTGLFLGFLSLCIYGDAASFLVQVLAFFGQALATREPRSGQYVTNALEVIYLASVLYMYMIQV